MKILNNFSEKKNNNAYLPHALSFDVDSHPGFPHCSQFLSTFRRWFASIVRKTFPSRRPRVRVHINPSVGSTEFAPKYFSHFFKQGINAFLVSWGSKIRDPLGSLINMLRRLPSISTDDPARSAWIDACSRSGLFVISTSKRGARWSNRSARTGIKSLPPWAMGSWERKYLAR